ncbi:hypothetical protein BRYFOR_05423 [Marvinbryantia formatexigens DSM 14469]|uniref:Uncharacterized protein n=1 Tax=Marvinbryantia formatexigens DSM 14469 TaxID=478749 RepID=C6L9Y1_9FIRM|nr:hypothetical protein [Marvinbryantia formatexigens]EET62388.1 hypothetical protein BRYFOR_05423 [Marvinbryantia formatexigens DSM 14469]UWO25068.1 hypothetical protein NQ534_00785 [Marvinbryantia formatexigens DSM 14469]SDG29435.1 hypothetical protein SAMN05660368_02298 [Marvinbryantia formatexigens]
MYSKKKLQVIENVKNMPNKEADILEVFMSGFRAGKQSVITEMENNQANKTSQQPKKSHNCP